MATVTNNANRTFPILLAGDPQEITPDTITIGTNTRQTRRFTDTDANGFQFTNTTTAAEYNGLELYTELMTSNANTAFTFNDSHIVLLEVLLSANTTDQITAPGAGDQTFNRTTVIRAGVDVGDANSRRMLMGPTGAGTWTTTDATFIGYRNNELTLIYQGAPAANTTNTGLTLIGNMSSEYSSAHTSLRTTWNNGGGTGQAAGGIYTYRITQFNGITAGVLAESNNVTNVEAGSGTRAVALFAGDDLRNIATDGNDANYGDGTSNTFLMINRRAVHWIVGGLWDGTLRVGHHTGNAPSSGQLAEIRYIVPFNPSFQDANNVVLTDPVRARFYDAANTTEVRNIFAPDTWNPTTPPVFQSGIDRTLAGTHWIEDSRTVYNGSSGASAANVTPVPAYTNKVMRARAYGVIIPENITIDADAQNALVTELTESTATRIEYVADPNVGTVTRAQALDIVDNGSNFDNIDQVYAAIQYNWAVNQPLSENIPVTVNGTELDFGSLNVNFGNTAFGIGSGAISLPFSGSVDGGTLFNIIRTTGAVTFANGATQGDGLTVLDSNAPGAEDIVFSVPSAWRTLAGAYYATFTGSAIVNHGLTSSIGSSVVVSTSSPGTVARLALVHPDYADVIVSGTSNNTNAVTVVAGDPVINPTRAVASDNTYPVGTTAASYFGVYTTLDNDISPVVAIDPNDGTSMSVRSLITASSPELRLSGSRFNEVVYGFKGGVFGARYAQLVARSGVSHITSTSIFGATTSASIDYAFITEVVTQSGQANIEGTIGTQNVNAASHSEFVAAQVDYDIIQARSGTALDERLLDRANNIRASRLVPRRST